MAADALKQFALAALFALLASGDAGFVGKHFVAGPVEIDDEFFPELFYSFAPVELAFLDFVELFFQPRGKGHVKNVLETLYQQNADAFAQHGRRRSDPAPCVTYSRSTIVEIMDA